MHGVLKVKTTAEQEAERKKEREEKSRKFTAVTKQIFEKRKNGELDETMLELTEKLLEANPDFYTMWNIRKEILLAFPDQRAKEEMQKLYLHELRLLQLCLRVNPKSYCIWNHRRFCLENMPDANWNNDLKLCNEFLSYDARNFHCWDYRRYVVNKSGIPSEEEFAFTTKKICENFSNYSAWHYRSKLLPLIYPDSGHKDKVEEAALLKEFELAQNAFFTDPNDQSAWFYQRWLLGRGQKDLEVLYFGVQRKQNSLHVIASFSKPINLLKESDIHLLIDNENVENLEWKSSDMQESHRCVWICDFTFKQEGAKISLKIGDCTAREVILEADKEKAQWHWLQDKENAIMFRDEHTAAKSSVLESELTSCKLLLEEEADNKWVMLTIVFLMRALDPEKYKHETETLLIKLMQCDKMRKNYYLDLRSKHRIEDELEKLKKKGDQFETFSLRNMELTTVYHWQYLTGFKILDLSCNKLKSLKGSHALQTVESISADNNDIADLDGVEHLQHLTELSVRNNNIKSADDLENLKKSSKLQKIYLAGNPFCEGRSEEDRLIIQASLSTLQITL